MANIRDQNNLQKCNKEPEHTFEMYILVTLNDVHLKQYVHKLYKNVKYTNKRA